MGGYYNNLNKDDFRKLDNVVVTSVSEFALSYEVSDNSVMVTDDMHRELDDACSSLDPK